MRKIYLVRHGKVDFQGGVRRCIGRTDVPLSEEGRKQARRLAEYFACHPVEKVYYSPLVRTRETAQLLVAGRYEAEPAEGLVELFMGEWENVPMTELKKSLESEPETGEGRVHGLARMRRTIDGLLANTQGDIAVVAHAGINCCFLSSILGTPLETSRALRQPYGGISVIEVNDEERPVMTVCALGISPAAAPDDEEIQALWTRYETPERVIAHCRAVAHQAAELGKRLNEAGYQLDLSVISAAALLHDLMKGKPRHAEAGAAALEKEGYLQAADVIRQHHELRQVQIDEAAVVFLADKWFRGEQRVSLEERFKTSRERFADQPEAVAAHDRRYKQAVCLETMVRKMVTMEDLCQ